MKAKRYLGCPLSYFMCQEMMLAKSSSCYLGNINQKADGKVDVFMLS